MANGDSGSYWGLLLGAGLTLTHDKEGKPASATTPSIERLFGWFDTADDCEAMATLLIEELGAKAQWNRQTPSADCGKCGSAFSVVQPHAALMIMRETREKCPQFVEEVKSTHFCPACSVEIAQRAKPVSESFPSTRYELTGGDSTTKH